MATPAGFEPAISTVTGWHVRPLHYGAAMINQEGDITLLHSPVYQAGAALSTRKGLLYRPATLYSKLLCHNPESRLVE